MIKMMYECSFIMSIPAKAVRYGCSFVLVLSAFMRLRYDIYHCHSLSIAIPQNTPFSQQQSTLRPPRPIQRIAIIGCGISGLSVAHSLLNCKQTNNSNSLFETIDLFDARTQSSVYDNTTSSTSLGAGIQLNGGLSILHQINPTLQEAVYNAGCTQIQIESRTNSWKKRNNDIVNDVDNTTGSTYDQLLQLNLKKTIESSNNENAINALLLDYNNNDSNDPTPVQGRSSDKKLLWISIMRGALQRVLYEQLPNPSNPYHEQKDITAAENQNSWNAYFQKKLINIRSSTTTLEKQDDTTTTSTEVYCQFDDGTEYGPYDIIIGCDGINSVCKQYIDSFGKLAPQQQKINIDRKNNKLAIYSGLRIRYAVADGDAIIRSHRTSKLTQYFGNGAYALHGTYGNGMNQPVKQCSFIVYLDPKYIGPFRKNDKNNNDHHEKESTTNVSNSNSSSISNDENVDWVNDERRTIDLARQNMLEQLNYFEIPGNETDELRQTVRNANVFFELGSYYHNPFGSWSCTVPATSSSESTTMNHPAHIVLCGDAAHALPPFLGQGSNQAIQDAYCLVQKINEYNTRVYISDDKNVTLQALLQEYENIRWFPCFDVFLKAAFLGYLETGGTDGLYSKFRDVFFKTMGIIGVASKVLLKAATPKVQ